MPYNINKYNQDLAATVEDGTVDNSLDIKLIGKNYAGYGEVQNENFVFLLENFAGTSEPPKKITGQIWFDSNTSKLKFYDGTQFRTTGGAEIGTAEPSGLTTGDFWFNTATNQLFAWDGGAFSLVGPQAVADADITQLRSRSVTDTSNNVHAIIEAVVDGTTVHIISTTEFTLKNSVNSIAGFSVIKKGITLINTPAVTAGSDISGVTGTDYRLWGTSSNSEKLGGVSAANFVRSDVSVLPTVAIKFSDLGLTVGDDDDVKLYIEGTTPVFQNQVSSTIEFRTTSSGTKTPMKLVGLDILPGTHNVSNIGSNTFRYSTMYAVSFNGTATTSDAVNVAGTPRVAATLATANTIAARTLDGDLNARLFSGIATQANYADLAEKYLADAEYEIGTVLMIGGEKEVTACTIGSRAIGPVSAHPAFLMNKSLEGGTTVALKGRVPVKVIGSVKKGDELIASDNGCAVVAVPHSSGVFAIALQSSDDIGIKLVEALVL
jgi:hypothetical protein